MRSKIDLNAINSYAHQLNLHMNHLLNVSNAYMKSENNPGVINSYSWIGHQKRTH